MQEVWPHALRGQWKVRKVSHIVHGGRCCLARLKKVKGQRIYVHWVNSQSSKNGVFPQHRVSSVWQVHTVVLHHLTDFFLSCSFSQFLSVFPPLSSLRCSSLATHGKRGGIVSAGTRRRRGRMRKRSKRWWWRWWWRRRGGRGKGSSSRCWRRWCWAGRSAPRWSWRRWQRCGTPARRRRAAAPASGASTRSSPCSWRERKGEESFSRFSHFKMYFFSLLYITVDINMVYDFWFNKRHHLGQLGFFLFHYFTLWNLLPLHIKSSVYLDE